MFSLIAAAVHDAAERPELVLLVSNPCPVTFRASHTVAKHECDTEVVTVPELVNKTTTAGHDAYDVSGPEEDWKAHMDDVATRALPLPDDVAVLLQTLRERLDELVDEEPVVVLRAAEQMEAIVVEYGPLAARSIRGDVVPLLRLAEALGMTEKAAGSRLTHYAHLAG